MSETEKEELRKRAKDLKEARLKRRIRLERKKVRPIIFFFEYLDFKKQ